MTDRKFSVWNTHRGDRLVVSDVRDANEDDRPAAAAAVFPISVLYDKDIQTKRAHDYANYLNKLNEAAKVAYEQIHLVDVLKR